MQWIILEKLILLMQLYIVLVALKSLSIGSEFSFYYLFKYGKLYINWYRKRQTFREYLIDKKN